MPIESTPLAKKAKDINANWTDLSPVRPRSKKALVDAINQDNLTTRAELEGSHLSRKGGFTERQIESAAKAELCKALGKSPMAPKSGRVLVPLENGVYEAIGNSYAEAMATQIPCTASFASGFASP